MSTCLFWKLGLPCIVTSPQPFLVEWHSWICPCYSLYGHRLHPDPPTLLFPRGYNGSLNCEWECHFTLPSPSLSTWLATASAAVRPRRAGRAMRFSHQISLFSSTSSTTKVNETTKSVQIKLQLLNLICSELSYVHIMKWKLSTAQSSL